MSVALLQEKIRKTKNPTVLDIDFISEYLPPHILVQERMPEKAYSRFCVELLEALRGFVPAVKCNFAGFALRGSEGLATLSRILDMAKRLGYYVILEVPEALTPQRAKSNAEILFSDSNLWTFDGLLVSSYIGSDGLKPYVSFIENSKKSLFVTVRTGNRSAADIQDLLTGGRNVFDAMADVVNRFENPYESQNAFHKIALVGPASSSSILKKLREKYPKRFILVDGFDYSNSNAKICAEAADRLGHGIIVSSGSLILNAWRNAENDGVYYLDDAKNAAERMKKNLTSYFTIL